MPEFQWNPSSNQRYTVDYGSTSLSGSGNTFNKDDGTSFVMYAANCILTLSGMKDDIPADNVVEWPDNETSSEGVRVDIEQGKLVLNNIDLACFGISIGGYANLLAINIAGEFNTQVKAGVIFGLLKKEFPPDPASDVLVKVFDQGKFTVDAPEIILTSGVIQAQDTAEVVMTADLIDIKLEGEFRDLQVSPCFKLSAGSAIFYFYGKTNGVSAFDFVQNDYEQGSFYFDTNRGINRGHFVFKGITDGNMQAQQWQAMLNKQLISWNGTTDPDTIKLKIRPVYENDGFYIMLF